MGDSYVKAKYEALKEYCFEYGIGYLMIDERLNDFETLAKESVNKDLENRFIEYFDNRKTMKYKDFIIFKEINPFTTREFVNILANNNNLIFSARPFYIKYNK